MAAGAACGRSTTLTLGPVVLQEIEIDGGEIRERIAEVADHRNSFQENFGQHDGRSDVEIDAAVVHVLHQRAEQAEIVVRGAADDRRRWRWDGCAACRCRWRRAR